MAKGGTTDPQFTLAIYARTLPEKFLFMVSPDGEMELKKSAWLIQQYNQAPYQSCDSDSEDSGDSKSSGD